MTAGQDRRRADLDAIDRLMRQSGGMPPAPVPVPLHKMAVVIQFPVPPREPDWERLSEIFALADEVWAQRDAEELREANARHAGRLAARLQVVRD